MTVSISIGIGVVSGVLTALLLFVISSVMRHTALPWYRRLIYGGIDISGQWLSEKENPSGNHQNSILNIRQDAGVIRCTFNVAKMVKDSGKVVQKTFKLNGFIQDRIVCCWGKNIDERSIGYHIELLEVVGDGKSMKGACAWYSATGERIEHLAIEWKRVA